LARELASKIYLVTPEERANRRVHKSDKEVDENESEETT
jgi:hypothetical protein